VAACEYHDNLNGRSNHSNKWTT